MMKMIMPMLVMIMMNDNDDDDAGISYVLASLSPFAYTDIT
jgi:hypothetical protein